SPSSPRAAILPPTHPFLECPWKPIRTHCDPDTQKAKPPARANRLQFWSVGQRVNWQPWEFRASGEDGDWYFAFCSPTTILRKSPALVKQPNCCPTFCTFSPS